MCNFFATFQEHHIVFNVIHLLVLYCASGFHWRISRLSVILRQKFWIDFQTIVNFNLTLFPYMRTTALFNTHTHTHTYREQDGHIDR